MADKQKPAVTSVPNYYNGVGHVAHLSTDQARRCEHCETQLNDGGSNFSGNVNHYITKHGYKLLHVGVETSHDPDGKPWHATIAVLGRGVA